MSGSGRSSYYTANPKAEEELAVAIKKALSIDESAPKQKHVRACILYTWDVKGSGSFWTAVKTYPLMADEIVIFKCLITIHKVIRQGHPMVYYQLYMLSWNPWVHWIKDYKSTVVDL